MTSISSAETLLSDTRSSSRFIEVVALVAKPFSELVAHVVTNTELNKLVVITTADNVASVRTAEKSGFVQVGAPREDPAGVCLIWRRGPRSSDGPDQRLDSLIT
jgi:hypothetical protein